MGVKLVKRGIPFYDYKDRTYTQRFVANKEYHKVPLEVEKYLLETNYFIHVPSKSSPQKPRSVALADRNRARLKRGEIDAAGRPTVDGKPVVSKPQTLDVYEDEDGNPVYEKPGSSMLDSNKARPKAGKQKADRLKRGA